MTFDICWKLCIKPLALVTTWGRLTCCRSLFTMTPRLLYDGMTGIRRRLLIMQGINVPPSPPRYPALCTLGRLGCYLVGPSGQVPVAHAVLSGTL